MYDKPRPRLRGTSYAEEKIERVRDRIFKTIKQKLFLLN